MNTTLLIEQSNILTSASEKASLPTRTFETTCTLLQKRSYSATFTPFPNDKFSTFPNSRTLQTTILDLMKMADSPKG